jgi:hypothetical protein
MTMIAIAKTATLTSTRMIETALPSVDSLASSLTRRLITPSTSSRAQTAPCSAKAMMNRPSQARPTRGGSSA